MHINAYDLVLEVAVGNHGYVSVRDAMAAGIDPVVLRKLVAAGRLERTAQGVYRVPFLAAGPHAAYAEAVAWTRGCGVISHESALDLLELCDVNPPLIHLTVPRGYAPRRRGGEAYRVWRHDQAPVSVIVYDGLPVVRPVDSILECLVYGTEARLLLQACETAARAGYLAREERMLLEARLRSPQRAVRRSR